MFFPAQLLCDCVTVRLKIWPKETNKKHAERKIIAEAWLFLFPDLLIRVRAWPCDFDYKQQWPMSRQIISVVSQEIGMDPVVYI